MTANDIFTRAIALIDEINATTGQVDPDTTEDYEARAPYLIDLLQKELAKTSKYTKVADVLHTPSTTDIWVSYAVPADADIVEKVYLSDNPEERLIYHIEINGLTKKIYIAHQEAATLKVVYRAIPATVTALANTLVLDDFVLNAMPYGLAKKFVEVEQNDFLVSIFANEYEQQKAIVRKPESFEKITNAYGSI